MAEKEIKSNIQPLHIYIYIYIYIIFFGGGGVVLNDAVGSSHRCFDTWTSSKWGPHGGTVVKALCYKSKGRWFDSRWCHWDFSVA